MSLEWSWPEWSPLLALALASWAASCWAAACCCWALMSSILASPKILSLVLVCVFVFVAREEGDLHVGVADRGFEDFRVGDYEEDLLVFILAL